MMQVMVAALRVYCDITWLALTFVIEPFSRIIHALKLFRVPTILVEFAKRVMVVNDGRIYRDGAVRDILSDTITQEECNL